MLRSYDGERFNTLAARGVPEAYAQFLQENRGLPPTGTGLQRLVEGAPFVHSADAMAEEGYSGPVWRAMVELGRARAVLAVPLHKDDGLVGSITVYRQEARPFSDKQIALLQNFAAQAVIAMENARLISETREALEQQTATAEVLQVINSSPGNLAPVFDAMLTKATSLCAASFGILWIFDGEFAHAGALHQVPAAYAELCRAPFRPSPGSGPARMMQGEDSFAIADLTAYPPYQAGDALTRAIVDLGGARSVVIAPLRRDDITLGAITIYQQDLRPFSDKQIALLQNFAAQAVIAMENARLITETHEALEQQTATTEVLQVINSSPGDLAPVFDAMLEKATSLCAAPYGALRVFDGEHFGLVAIHGEPAFTERMRREVVTGGALYEPIRHGERVVSLADARESTAYQTHAVVRERVDLGGTRSYLAVALRKDESLAGVLIVYRQEVRPFSDKEIALLENFAAQAVIAMENARLLGELRARTEEIAGWNRELEARVAAQLAELERTGKLKRFLAPQLAELIIAQGDESILESHRREIVVVFCDLRGFTGFAERAEPEEVMALLRDYHGAMGPIVASFEGTLDHYAGDGIMVFFNDPLPTPEPARRAIEMAVAMRQAAADLIKTWHRHGHDIGFGVGISQGYATLGQIGFAERMDYTAIGTVTNLAARLCAEAQDGQILISRRVATAVEDMASLEEIGDLSLKGLSQAVAVYNVAQ